MSISFIKLIDYSLFPAIILVLGKLIGVFFIAALFSIKIEIINFSSAIFAFETVVSATDLPVVSSYSDLLTFIIMAFGFAIIIINAVYFHDSHISIATLNKLIKNNLLSLLKGSFELYHSGTVWLIFLWLANLLILFNVIMQRTYLWILLITVIFSISLTLIYLRDLFKEVSLLKKKHFFI